MQPFLRVFAGVWFALFLFPCIAGAQSVFPDERGQASSYAPPSRTPAAPRPTPSGDPTPASANDTLVAPAIVTDVLPLPAEMSSDPQGGMFYRIGPSDLLRIEVFQVEELSSEERVTADGQIFLPLIGALQVGGLSQREAEALIAAKLGEEYLQDPQVDIYVIEYASQNVTVMGRVKRPGVFPLKGRTTMLQALAMAEGADELANEEETVVFRADDAGQMQAYIINLEKIQTGEIPDPLVIGNDRIVVPASGTKVFFKGVADTLRGFVRIPIY